MTFLRWRNTGTPPKSFWFARITSRSRPAKKPTTCMPRATPPPTRPAAEGWPRRYAAIDAVTDKVARQMRKYKTRLMRKHRPRKDIVQHLEEHVLHPEPTEEDEHQVHAIVSSERLP